jgi:hypothetical protein
MVCAAAACGRRREAFQKTRRQAVAPVVSTRTRR